MGRVGNGQIRKLSDKNKMEFGKSPGRAEGCHALFAVLDDMIVVHSVAILSSVTISCGVYSLAVGLRNI